MKTVLVTGGAGYVGSHCCKAFARAGWQVVSFDNLSRGWRDAVKWGPLIEGDICDAAAVAHTLDLYRPHLVAHFAGYAYVAESIERPDDYYRNNCFGTLTLLHEMHKANIRKVIFSSTCATYGIPSKSPIDEGHPQSPINPYGWSKFFIERMLEDYGVAYGFSSIALRYFNAAGCDPEGDIGERHEPEPHLIPLAINAALDKRQPLVVNGTDFHTRDGSAVRDYVHVADLARAHALAGEFLMRKDGSHVFNLGTGVGTTVLEVAAAVGRACGDNLTLRAGPRRPGDPPMLVASAEKARRELGWTPTDSTIDFIVETAIAWQKTLRT
jgi:UDP-arabinose 4-epimerase